MPKPKSREELQKLWSKVVAKSWTDEKFKERLMRNPEATLREMGFDLPKNQKVEVHKQDSKVFHLVLPEKPADELLELELKEISGGAHCYGLITLA